MRGTADFADALEELPDLGSGPLLRVTWADMEAVRRANDLEVPDLSDQDETSAFFGSISGADDDAVVYVPGSEYDQVHPPQVSEDELGFSWVTADEMASVSVEPDDLVWLAFDDRPEAADGLGDAGDGVLSLDEDQRYVGVDGDQAEHASSQEAVADWLDGDDRTLADDEDVAAIAEAIDDADAISATIFAIGSSGDLVGFGWVDDGGKPAFVVVYGTDDDEAAEDAVDGIEKGFAEVDDELDVDEVEADGSLVVVTGHQRERPVAPLQLFTSFELPVPE